MGVVYLAHDALLDRRCAVKLLLGGAHADRADVDRFRREAQAVARLQHPGIIQIFEVGEHLGLPFMALEYCSGGTLAARLHAGPLAPADAAGVARDLAEAVGVAHAAGVVHRDLKPANILFDETGKSKLADFGLARRSDETRMTRSGAVVGTPSYMAPEQARGDSEVGPAADIYALGAILYETLTGRPPFRAATVLETLKQVLADDPVAPRVLNPAVPRDLETIALKCLRKESSRRYGTAAELADDLERWRRGEAILARRVGPAERAAKWCRRYPAAAALMLALAAGVGVSSWFAYRANREAARADLEADAAVRAGNEAALREAAEGEAKNAARAERAKAEERADAARRAEARADAARERAEWLVYGGKLSLAQAAFREGTGGRAARYLDECAWHFRGWEHAHLRARYGGVQRLVGHHDSARHVAWSPDGTRMLTAGGKSAIVWDAESGTSRLTLIGHTNSITSVAWSPDGKRLLTTAMDGAARVWDAVAGIESVKWSAPAGELFSAAWHPDGRRFLAVGDGGVCRVIDADTGAELASFGEKGKVGLTEWSPDGAEILTGGEDGVTIRDAAKGVVRLAFGKGSGRSNGVAWHPDGKRILGCGEDGVVRVWSPDGSQVLALRGRAGSALRASWSPDGSRIVTTGDDGTARIYDAVTGEESDRIGGYARSTTVARWSPEGRRLLVGGTERTPRVYAADRGTGVRELLGHNGSVTGACFSADSASVLTTDSAGVSRTWDARTGRLTGQAEPAPHPVGRTVRSPDGSRVIRFGTADGPDSSMVTVTGGGRPLTLRHKSAVASAAWSPDGKRIVTGGRGVETTARVWDAVDGRELFTLDPEALGILLVAWSPDGTRILTSSYERTVLLWDVARRNIALRLRARVGEVKDAAWSPDGKRLLTGGNDSAVIWDAVRGNELLRLSGHTDWIGALAWSPDGSRVLTGGADRTARIWDAVGGAELLTLGEHSATVIHVAWSPDGRRVLTASSDGTARVYDSAGPEAIRTLRGHTTYVQQVGFTPDGKRLFAWDRFRQPAAWSTLSGRPADTADPPVPAANDISPDGRLRARASGFEVEVTELARLDPAANRFPLPDAADRRRYHTERADAAEKRGRHFEVAFHLGRLLLDDPASRDLRRRREAAFLLNSRK